MEEVRRQELVERLLGILVEFIPFQLPEETDALTEQHLARKARSLLATEPAPEWVLGVINRVQQHLDGETGDSFEAVLAFLAEAVAEIEDPALAAAVEARLAGWFGREAD